ncbi:MAG: DNA polymerase III subunit alpha [Ignavibacteriaceae bacterium]|nr:DNA polymerase III subunit alpha [Ignavibacteriaceae bacterium]
MSDFIHLHNHTHYSLQDGACTVEHLINAARNNDMKAVALTDHGVLYGIPEFYRKAKSEGIKPILGMEAYIVKEGKRTDRGKGDEVDGRKKTKPYHHLILLAKNNKGYENLSKLSTIGHLEGFYYRPRIDFDVLKKHSEGLICTSACAAGIVSSYLVNNDYEKARANAIKFKELFGDDFYLEIQDHNLEVDKPILEGVPRLSRELGIKMVATNDCHYIEREHSIAHNILLLLSDKNGEDFRTLRYGTDQIYFKSASEMKKLFKNYKGAIENTLEIEEKVDIKLDFGQYHFPVFPIPGDSSAKSFDDYLEQLTYEGLHKKIKNITSEIEDRIKFELNTIKAMGFSGYFLIVQDFINSSKKKNIVVGPGRGSAAGSLVAFCLGITNINPLEYDLLFERFLNPDRKSLPDIDIDFADDQRAEVIDYVRKKYGNDCVSQIITFNRLSSKAVIRDVARVLKIPIPTVNKITKHIPSKFGKVFTIDQALADVPELKWVKESSDPDIQNLIKYSKVLEGMNRNMSKHAAGIVITPDDVSNYVPLATAVSQTDVVTQYNMKEIEYVGLLKMDFLGLRRLTIIRDSIALIKKNHNVEIDIDNLPLDDEKTFQLFSKGQTTGIFQFESSPMREYLKRLHPTSINDLSAMNALYRPGPMDFINDYIDRKFGRQTVTYPHPILENILKETYGIIVYQEQVIQIANKVAGMTLSEADILRRAMGKKDLRVMKEQKVKFINGAVKNGIDKKIAEEIFEAIFKFANYGFNKSHSVAYSYVAYQTAYIKAHYTAEFLAASLTNEFENTNKVSGFLEDCRKLKIVVLPPDVNNPSVGFDVVDGKIRFGLSAIKNVGVSAVEEIIRSREKLSRNFTSIFDFCVNVDNRIVNKRCLEGLVLAGAFDSINKSRSQLFNSIELALDFAHKVQNSKIRTSESLFGHIEEEVRIPEPKLLPAEEWSERETLSKERQVIGFYVTGHPFYDYEVEYKSFSSIHLGETADLDEAEVDVTACGIITELETKIDRVGRTMAFFKLDDFSGSSECIMFSKIYDQYGKFLKLEEPVFIIGKLESSGDAIKLHINKLIPIDLAREEMTQSIRIVIAKEKNEPEKILAVKNILSANKGSTPVYLHLTQNGNKGSLFNLKDHRVKLSKKFIREIVNLLGDDSLILWKK